MKGSGPALIIGLGGKGKKGSDDSERDESAEDEMGDAKDMHLSDAFDAAQEGDKEAFIEAMKKCLLVANEGGYTGPDEGDEE